MKMQHDTELLELLGIGKVYVVTNQKNGKKYVGFTNGFVENRLKIHIKGGCQASSLLHNAIVEFGKENFSIETVFEGTCKQALDKERFFVKKLKTRYPNGYNIMPGGLSFFLGKKHTLKARKRMSKMRRGNKNLKGYKHSSESRRKMSEAKKGNKNSLGYRHTKETRKNMSISHKGYNPSPETRARISAAMKGNKHALKNKI